jgi:alpha-beta hydrolase superfamily lysophospholipase
VGAQVLKEVVAASLPRGGALAMVRRHPAGQARGAVLMLHGFSQNRYSWHLPSGSFTHFLAQRGYDVFNAELRGVGRSRLLGSRIPSSFDEHVDEDLPVLVDAARRASGEDRIFLLGHSMGGALAYAAAPTLTPRPRGVIGIAAVYRFGHGVPFWRQVSPLLLKLPPWLNAPVVLSPVGPLLSAGAGEVIARFPLPVTIWNRGAVERHTRREYMSRAWDRTSLQVMRAFARWSQTGRLDSDKGLDYGARFAALSEVPLLVVAGMSDAMVTEDDVRPAYSTSRSDDRTYLAFPGMGHVDLIWGKSSPRVVWPAIADWMDRR